MYKIEAELTPIWRTTSTHLNTLSNQTNMDTKQQMSKDGNTVAINLRRNGERKIVKNVDFQLNYISTTFPFYQNYKNENKKSYSI